MKIRSIGILLFSIILLSNLNCYSQEKSYFNVDVGLSQTYKGFFYLFDGVIDVGAGYNYRLVKDLYAGPSFHMDFLNRKNTSGRTQVYKPKFNLLYEIKIVKRFFVIPVASVGYSFLNISNKEFDYKETQQGILLGGDLRLLWKTNNKIDFYLFGRYDYIYMNKDYDFSRLEYYRDVNLTSFGIGINIKPKQHEK